MEKRYAVFSVYELDVVPDEYGGWIWNDKIRVGSIHVPNLPGIGISEVSILKALKKLTVTEMTGRKYRCLETRNRRKVFIEDLSESGHWFEVGAIKDHKPMYSVEYKYSEMR